MIGAVPWYPYPKVGVAELDPPNYATKTTSWNFTAILPQLELFMNATYGNGKRVVPNFSTQPTWMVKQWYDIARHVKVDVRFAASTTPLTGATLPIQTPSTLDILVEMPMPTPLNWYCIELSARYSLFSNVRSGGGVLRPPPLLACKRRVH